ncbi:MAG: glycosyltransferase family 4 protein [Methylovulum sp.]|nr:glycosyltransferase family 4 protein [Methylovulum sp.]
MKLTLLIIGFVWPEPTATALGSRMLELIQLFTNDNWSIVFASAGTRTAQQANLSAWHVTEQAISLNDASFDAFVAGLQPTAVLFDRFFTEEQFAWRVEKVCPLALRILDTEDFHSLRQARHTLLKKAQHSFSKESERQSCDPVTASAAQLHECIIKEELILRELAAIYRCDLSLLISDVEHHLLTEYFAVPATLLQYCPFLNTLPVSTALLPSFAERLDFISIGNFRHEPNWDSVLYLKHAIWPLIRKHLPQAQLLIYGAYAPPKASQLHAPQHGFLVKGRAEEALGVMQQARVCLAPLRFGAGIKGKLMDAMRVGTPSVTTSIGAEAMAGEFPWGGTIADSAQAFASAAIALYDNAAAWQAAQTHGFAILHQYFTRADFGQLLLTRIHQLLTHRDSERLHNITGLMLRHHHHKSTHYLSLWIEEKNKQQVNHT